MLILIAIGAMLSYPRPEPWGQPESNEAEQPTPERQQGRYG